MSTGNFDSRQKFGLYCFSPSSYTQEYKICEKCGNFNIMDNECCDICDESLEDCNVETEMDYMWVTEDYIPQMSDSFKDLNCMFHTLYFKDGYYEGVQLDIEEIYDLEDVCDSYAKAEFDLYPSQLKRKWYAEERKIERWLKKMCKEFPIDEYIIAYQFSNGETGYSKVA